LDQQSKSPLMRMKTTELSTAERELIAFLEPKLRKAVWNDSAKVFEGSCESDGKWIEYPLRHPARRDLMRGKYYPVTLKADDASEDFFDCFCAFGTNHLHTPIAVYRILRALKGRGLLNVPGFDNFKI
ncbi:MAG TPA: hypothetical protein VM260_18495, partial [Pirellula sp.]|nr:hypothetical protein [Pirellula sp.]